MNKTTIALLLPAVFLVTLHLSYAGSATWNSNPESEYWSDNDNWTPASYPELKLTLTARAAGKTLSTSQTAMDGLMRLIRECKSFIECYSEVTDI